VVATTEIWVKERPLPTSSLPFDPVRSDAELAPVDAPHLDNRRENEVLDEIGAGTYLTPKPNRLVVMAGSTPHMINRVHAAAGTNARCAVAGFFVRASALPASRS